MALTRAKLMELIDNGDIDVGGGGANPNLLHNSDFRNPVNQREVSGAISSGSYFYDRWIRNSGTVTVAAGYLTLASGAVVEQRIEGNLLAGVICTISFEVDSTIYHGSGAFPTNNGTVSVEVDGYPNITFGCATGYMFVLIPATSDTSIKRFKCEMGFASTLHLDPPMEYGTELLKCMRYYETNYYAAKPYFSDGTNITTTGLIIASFPMLVRKRITPTVTVWDAAKTVNKCGRVPYGSATVNNNAAATSEISSDSFIVVSDSGVAASALAFYYDASADL